MRKRLGFDQMRSGIIMLMSLFIKTAPRSAQPVTGLRRNLVFVLPPGLRMPLLYVTYFQGQTTDGVNTSDCFLSNFLSSDCAHPRPGTRSRPPGCALCVRVACGVRARLVQSSTRMGQRGRPPAVVVTEEVPQLDTFLTFPNIEHLRRGSVVQRKERRPRS